MRAFSEFTAHIFMILHDKCLQMHRTLIQSQYRAFKNAHAMKIYIYSYIFMYYSMAFTFKCDQHTRMESSCLMKQELSKK